tara:strand:- start:1876 stop:2520 length:645 start_codon:yes stop_codon:yes gene_type:complete
MDMSFINEFFDKVFCINLDRREDRMLLAEEEFKKFNIEFERFSAVDGNTLVKEDYTTNPNIPGGAHGCRLSHARLVSMCKERSYKKALVLEDDVVFSEDFEKNFTNYIKEIPENWDMFYLGGNHNFHMGQKLQMVSEHIGKCHTTFSTHAYAINESLFDEAISVLSNGEKQVDVYYSEIQKRRNVYALYPGVTNQRADYSDVLNENVDYSKIIK